ncbi:MAG TPA: tail fiber domain-containing protein [Phycisphaerales bacterium]|nr:tail fiber domain-containing protein [Phycisphaerales bacterium]
MHIANRKSALRALVMSVTALLAGAASAQTFTQNTAITIPTNGVGSVYPSVINVAGVPGTINLSAFSVNVNLSHSNPREVDIYLVSPAGDRIALLSDAGGTGSVLGTLRFSQGGRLPTIGETLIPNSFYFPTDFDPGDVLPAPAPAGAYAASFSSLVGDSPNGNWSLYVFDDTAGVGGSIANWSITFGGSVIGSSNSTATTYQGVIRDASNSLLTGTADITFRLYDSPSSTSANDLVAGPVTFNNVDLDDVTGTFTVNPDFGAAAYTSSTAKFIEVSVRSPAGVGAFTTLSPRQELRPAPIAQTSLRLASTFSSVLPAAEAVGTSVRIYGDLDVDGGQLDLRSGNSAFWRVNGDQTSNDYAIELVTQATADSVAVTDTVMETEDTSRRTTFNAGLDITRTVEVNGSTVPTVKIATGNNASVAADSAGFLVLGEPTGFNVVYDNNEIQGRNNGAVSDLTLNDEGGLVGIGRFPSTNVLEVEGNASKAVAGLWLANSDRRIKQDVQPVTNALATLAKVKPVTFMYTPEYAMTHRGVESSRRYYNVIAQEFAEVFPEVVKGSGEYMPGMDKNPAGEILQVDTYPATITSIAAINELHELLKKQQAEIERLSKEVEALRKK